MPAVNGLRYPELGDLTAVPTDLQNLATDIARKFVQTVPNDAALNTVLDMQAGDRVQILSTGLTATYNGTAWTIGRLIYNGTTFADPTDTAWVTPYIGQNGWVSYDNTGANIHETHGYRRVNGIVYLKGLISSGAAQAYIFTLPVGFRPSQRLMRTVHANGGSARMDIESGGGISIQAYASGSNNSFVSLAPTQFVAEQ